MGSTTLSGGMVCQVFFREMGSPRVLIPRGSVFEGPRQPGGSSLLASIAVQILAAEPVPDTDERAQAAARAFSAEGLHLLALP